MMKQSKGSAVSRPISGARYHAAPNPVAVEREPAAPSQAQGNAPPRISEGRVYFLLFDLKLQAGDPA